jgi:hypothetical protein
MARAFIGVIGGFGNLSIELLEVTTRTEFTLFGCDEHSPVPSIAKLNRNAQTSIRALFQSLIVVRRPSDAPDHEPVQTKKSL